MRYQHDRTQTWINGFVFNWIGSGDDMVKINTKIEELFEDKADKAGFCLDKKWGDYPNPYVDKSTRIAFDFFRSGFLTSDVCAKEKLEGCVVVPKDQIEVWWQDAEEPENFATQLKDLHFIADGLEDGDIMKIHEHHTIHMPSNTLYGAWTYKDCERVFITGTKNDVEAARGGK